MGLGCCASAAQTAEPTYKAGHDVCKVIFEDANYRVIEANHKKGVRDKVHGHPVSFVVVNLTDCKIDSTGPMVSRWTTSPKL
jgi:hypothetical protein